MTGIALLPGRDAAVIGTADGTVLSLDLRTGSTRLLHAANEAWSRGFHLSDDGRFVLSSSELGVATMFDLSAGRLVTPSEMVARVVPAAAFTADGDVVFVDGLGDQHAVRAPALAAS